MHYLKYVAAVLVAHACATVAAGQSPGNPQHQPAARLRLSEVSAGPAHCYIEVTNIGSAAGRLANVEIVTSRGAFPLGDIATLLDPGEYLLLARSIADEVGVSDSIDTKAKIVAVPILHAVQDTVLLRDGGTIVDAMAYGRVPDNSANYAAAVAAGQFANGQFVPIGSIYGEAAMGRNASNADTNDLAADWDVGGGADAQTGTPLAANQAIFAGEYLGMKACQELVNQVLCHNYYGFDVHHGSYSGLQVLSTGDVPGYEKHMVATHTFVCSSPDFGSGFTLSGSLEFQYVSLGGESYGVSVTGTMSAPTAGLSVFVDSTETVGLDGSTSDIDVVVQQGSQAYPWSGRSTLAFSGTRGAYTVANTRETTGQFGILRSSASTSQIVWALGQGEVDAVQNTFHLSRDWPASGRPISWGAPVPPFTTEVVDYVSTVTKATGADGFDMQIDGWVADYGSQFPEAQWNGAAFTLRRNAADDSVAGHFQADVQYGQYLTDLSWDSLTTEEANGERVDSGIDFYNGQNLVLRREESVDPLPLRGDLWDKFKARARRVVGWTTRRAMTGVAGAACVISTGLTAGSAGLTSWATLGAATPLGIAGTAAVAGMCCLVTTGCYEVLAPLDDA